MTVYYIGHPSGHVKIGYASCLFRRFEQLERQYRTSLELLAFEDGMRDVERGRHLQFGSDRINRHQEWFRPTPQLRDLILTLRPGMPYFEPTEEAILAGPVTPLKRIDREHSDTRLVTTGSSLDEGGADRG